MATGYIKSIKLDRDFGFIAPQGGADVYFNKRELRALPWDLSLENQRVEFEIECGPRSRPWAVNVRGL